MTDRVARPSTAILTGLMLLFPGALVGQTLAFPKADGYGRFTAGGRGGRVIEVVNLDDSGPGSLRKAVESEGARTIVFRVSGTIALESQLIIRHGDLTIAGETAPGDGICLRNYTTVISANNIIVRFMRFRLGDEAGQADDAMMSIGNNDIIIDHCSFSWGIDEVATFYNNERFTLQWCIISESLDNSVHPKGMHGYGGIWGGHKATFHHNLLAHNTSRNPRFQGGRWAGWESKEEADFRNNVVFNWGFECMYGGEKGHYNIVANYFKPGPASTRKSTFLTVWDTMSEWYVAGNAVEGYPGVSEDNRSGIRGNDVDVTYSMSPFPFEISETQPAHDAYASVLSNAGAFLPKRDAVDTRILEEVRSGRPRYGDDSYRKAHMSGESAGLTGMIDSQTTVGGWPVLHTATPPTDTDHDGIPDAWELTHGLDAADASDGSTITSSGYSNLELYLHELAGIQ